MADLTRGELIDAAASHDVQECSEIFASPELGTNRFGLLCSCGWRSLNMPKRNKAAMDRLALAHRLDAVLPLIADAIEAKGSQMYDRDDLEDRLEDYQTAYSEAADDLADLVRSLMGADDA